MFDNHSHTQYSGDIPAGHGNSVREMCISAIAKGLTIACDAGVRYALGCLVSSFDQSLALVPLIF
jgi:hypothetical protein